MLLRIHMACPGTGWVPGQVVDATVEQAREWSDGAHASPVRGMALEQADIIVKRRVRNVRRRRPGSSDHDLD
jgi:hypothetical protein